MANAYKQRLLPFAHETDFVNKYRMVNAYKQRVCCMIPKQISG